jgi:hypothetical protein
MAAAGIGAGIRGARAGNLPYENAPPAGFDLAQLRFFFENSTVELLTADAGVNNICIITVKLKDGIASPFVFYDFCNKRVKDLRILIIKMTLVGEGVGMFPIEYVSPPEQVLNGPSGLIKATNRQTFSSIQKEATAQNTIYYKSMLAFGKPLCPPIVAVVITEGREDLDLFALLLAAIDLENEKSKRLAKIIAGIIRNRNTAGIAFIVMGHINSNYKPISEWNISLQMPPDLEKIPENRYDAYAEFYKLSLIGYSQIDVNTGNIMISNPYIISNGEKLLFMDYYARNLEILNGDAAGLAAFKEKFKLYPECNNEHSVILIDFGVANERSFSKEMPVNSQLTKFSGAEDPFTPLESMIIQMKALGIDEAIPAAEDEANIARLNMLIGTQMDAVLEKIRDYRDTPGPIIRLKYENEKYKFCEPYMTKLDTFYTGLNAFVSRPMAIRQAMKPGLFKKMTNVEQNARSSEFYLPGAAAAADPVKKEDEFFGGGSLFGGNDDMGGGYRKKTRKNKKANKARRRSAKK